MMMPPAREYWAISDQVDQEFAARERRLFDTIFNDEYGEDCLIRFQNEEGEDCEVIPEEIELEIRERVWKHYARARKVREEQLIAEMEEREGFACRDS